MVWIVAVLLGIVLCIGIENVLNPPGHTTCWARSSCSAGDSCSRRRFPAAVSFCLAFGPIENDVRSKQA
jgi:hypothetical protein